MSRIDVEQVKENLGLNGGLDDALRDYSQTGIDEQLEQISKSHGIYVQFNRAQSGREKDWMYMIRLAIPGGGPLDFSHWKVLDDLARQHSVNPEGIASLRLTTRQAVQFHWVKKPAVLEIVRTAAEIGLLSLNACGDNVRNVMACPLGRHPLFDAQKFAQQLAGWFQLPTDPFIQVFAIDPNALETQDAKFEYGPRLLNRKFKISVGSLIEHEGRWQLDNCVEVRTHDLGFTPLLEAGKVERVAVWVGGGQGEKFGKATASLLAQPLSIVPIDQLQAVADGIVSVHRDWGDRENRHHARLKYLVRDKGLDWLRQHVSARTGVTLEPIKIELDSGPRHLHHGWLEGSSLSYGLFVENGRLVDNGPNGRLLSLVRHLLETFPVRLSVTANQDLIFHGLSPADKNNWEQSLASFGYGLRRGRPYSAIRLQSGSCVGRDTCRLAYTDSEKFEPELIDQLEALGWADLSTSIGITGCERQCFRPATKVIGLVGSGLNRYQFKFGGTEDARHQGVPLRLEGREYLRSVPRERVAPLLDVLFRTYQQHALEQETLGGFNRRLGTEGLVELFSSHQETADLMAKSVPFKEYHDEFAHRLAGAR